MSLSLLRNYTTLKLHSCSSPWQSRLSLLRNYTTLKPVRVRVRTDAGLSLLRNYTTLKLSWTSTCTAPGLSLLRNYTTLKHMMGRVNIAAVWVYSEITLLSNSVFAMILAPLFESTPKLHYSQTPPFDRITYIGLSLLRNYTTLKQMSVSLFFGLRLSLLRNYTTLKLVWGAWQRN